MSTKKGTKKGRVLKRILLFLLFHRKSSNRIFSFLPLAFLLVFPLDRAFSVPNTLSSQKEILIK
ncbi:MAG: hypothetical protein A2Y79_12485 [Deltaproteobacteria bacterium RBG_13_43_22]|nr:MAG: hypothetical protein A2Y79_12485 [Deltaproteobacteria bacterium RBG_13_43_22]